MSLPEHSRQGGEGTYVGMSPCPPAAWREFPVTLALPPIRTNTRKGGFVTSQGGGSYFQSYLHLRICFYCFFRKRAKGGGREKEREREGGALM